MDPHWFNTDQFWSRCEVFFKFGSNVNRRCPKIASNGTLKRDENLTIIRWFDEFSYRVTGSTLRNLSASTRGNTCTWISTRIGIRTSTQIGTSSWYTGTVIACCTMVVEGPHFTKNINIITPFPSSPLITALWKSPSLQAHSILPLFQNSSSYDDDVIAKQLNEKLTF